ncbi:5'-methylthioadenosine/S-adenosylhomocysteine nucleosidase family protein [Catenulispora pinisilvae]|uniref:5'-methylthioadenosine/S-adenosylhomocysteine nucleosidase family protein n=1 Tax=Catenulispora pinisilvae TaxID=2705253 RepID=UPI001890D79C|nr:5'-methylthioadenosine/S-adenosylhomocysteine nucleosidase [Catenulispora pinisilvae]
MSDGEFGGCAPAVVLTAIAPEYEAFRAHVDVECRDVHQDTWFEIGRMKVGGHPVVCAQVGPGNLSAGVLAERAAGRFAPRALLFAGIAASLTPTVRIGDVVVASKVYAYDMSKHVPDGELQRPAAWESSHGLLQVAHRALDGTAWAAGVVAGAGELVPVHYKPVAAGPVLLDSPDSWLRRHLYEHYNDAVALEMESVGLYTAGALNGTETLTIRGISDLADGRKSTADAGGSQQAAAARAAAAVAALIALIPPVEEKVRRLEKQDAGSPGGASVQFNRAEHEGVVNAVQNGAMTIHHGPSGTGGR